MQAPHELSHFLGTALHMHCTGDPALASFMTASRWNAYSDWLDTGLLTTRSGIAQLGEDDAPIAHNRIAFHELNYGMRAMWIPLWQEKVWDSDPDFRRNCINMSRDRLAALGVAFSLRRDRHIRAMGGTESIYNRTEDQHPIYKAHTGKMQEVDAAIVMLDVMRRNRGVTIIPAPVQFENSRHARRNVDFIALHLGARSAVGIQVRSHVTQEDRQTVDDKRVIFIDCNTDLGNIKAVRCKKGTSRERVVAWPGIIAAKCIERIKVHGKGKNLMAARDPEQIMAFRMYARQLVGNTTVDFSHLSDIVGERIMTRLEA